MPVDRPATRPPSNPPVLVEDAAGLERLMGELRKADEIAFDTEADSFYSYQERVCLIQVTVSESDYLVDPLCELDLSPLGTILADPAKIKVFHDGEYDVLILKKDFGFEFASLFDTRVAAAALGLEMPGLASVVNERFGIELDKSQQRSDWSKRPLTDSQIEYARQDTRYLLPLMDELKAELADRSRTHIVEGECRRLEGLEPTPREFRPDDFIRLKGARGLDRKEMRVLRELFVWRDGEAERRNVPPFKVMGNNTLLALARHRPNSTRSLGRVDGLSPKVVRRLGTPLLEVIAAAEELGALPKVPSLPPKDGTARLDEFEVELHDRLKTWRKGHAEREGIDASLVLNRHVLPRIAKGRPRALADLERVEGLLAWQLDSFGDELLDLVDEFERDVEAGRIEPSPRRRRR